MEAPLKKNSELSVPGSILITRLSHPPVRFWVLVIEEVSPIAPVAVVPVPYQRARFLPEGSSHHKLHISEKPTPFFTFTATRIYPIPESEQVIFLLASY